MSEVLRAQAALDASSTVARGGGEVALAATLVARARERGDTPAGEALAAAALVLLGVEDRPEDVESEEFVVRLEMSVTASSPAEAAGYFIDDAADMSLGERTFDIRRGDGPWRRYVIDPETLDA